MLTEGLCNCFLFGFFFCLFAFFLFHFETYTFSLLFLTPVSKKHSLVYLLTSLTNARGNSPTCGVGTVPAIPKIEQRKQIMQINHRRNRGVSL